VIALLVAVGLASFFAGVVSGIIITSRALTAMHHSEMERFGNMMTVGLPQVIEPEIVNADPDAAARIRADIHRERVANGVVVLQQRYRDQGLVLSDEEAALQVEAMLQGRVPVPE
jgi:hypothetical protein